MAASDEVRVVTGCAWDDDADTVRFFYGGPLYDSDRPALLVIDSGLTAEQMRAAIGDHEALRASLRRMVTLVEHLSAVAPLHKAFRLNVKELNDAPIEAAGLLAATDTGGTDGE